MLAVMCKSLSRLLLEGCSYFLESAEGVVTPRLVLLPHALCGDRHTGPATSKASKLVALRMLQDANRH